MAATKKSNKSENVETTEAKKRRGYTPEQRDFLSNLGVDASGRKGAIGAKGPRASTVKGVAEVSKAIGTNKGHVVVSTDPETMVRAAHEGLPKSLKVKVIVADKPASLKTWVQKWAEDNGRQVIKLPAVNAYVVTGSK